MKTRRGFRLLKAKELTMQRRKGLSGRRNSTERHRSLNHMASVWVCKYLVEVTKAQGEQTGPGKSRAEG